jgi:hypothetical protein
MYFIKYSAHFFKENYYEILSAHYTGKLIKKCVKINWVMQ